MEFLLWRKGSAGISAVPRHSLNPRLFLAQWAKKYPQVGRRSQLQLRYDPGPGTPSASGWPKKKSVMPDTALDRPYDVIK